MLVVLKELVGPVGDDVADSVTAPENPLRGTMLMIVEPELPAWIEREVGLAEIAKSGGEDVKVTVAECESDPLVPVTVTVKVPIVDGVHDKMEVPELVRLEGLRLQLISVEGDADEDNETVPVKAFRKPTVIVEVPVAPVATERMVGLAVRE